MYSKDPLIPFPKRPRKDIYEPGEILRDLLEVQNIQVQPKFEQLGPPPSYMGAVKQYLSDINNRLKDSKTELDILKNDQRSIRQFQPQLIGHFFERQDLLINNLSALQRELDQLTLNQILDAECTLSKAKIEEQIDKYLAEVMVHKNYLRFLSTPGTVQISELFCLQIEEQPLPLPITQKQNLSFQVSLLSAPGIPLRLSNPTVTAKFEIVEGQADGDSSKVNKINKKISGGTANLDSKDSSGYYKASFKKLSLDSPSHMKLIQFSFICTVEVILDSGSRMVAIESRPTYPYVIMANQKQWPQAEKSMFRAMNLSEQNLPWVKFCNLLHLHYLRVLLSANISEKDLRTLSLREFAFFKQKMFSVFERNNTPCEVQVSHFDKFWDWFGFVLRQLRYNKQIAQLWRRGYIFGFINKSEVEIILRQFAHTHGNPFIIRFSTTSAAGDITVGLYVTVEQQVHHIVVQPKRILSGLADYICTLDSLEFLVTTKTYFAIENLDQCGATPELKDNSIGQILDTNITKLIGYDDSMPSRSPQLQPFTNPVSTMPTPQPNLPMHNTQDVRHLVPPNVEPPRINIDFEYNILAPRDDYEWLNFETD